MLSGPLTTEAWADAAYMAFSVLENCEIEIYEPSAKTYNPATGKNEDGPETPVWAGRARVQTVHEADRDFGVGVDRRVQVYRFQIRRNSADVRDTMMIRVTDGGLNKVGLKQPFYIREVFNSGGSFEQTIHATENSAR